jgi:hypothetical protein
MYNPGPELAVGKEMTDFSFKQKYQESQPSEDKGIGKSQ